MAHDTRRGVRFKEANVVRRGIRLLAGTRPAGWLFARVLDHFDMLLLRRSNGRRSVTSFLTGLPIVELTTVGARSGKPRTLPVMGVGDGNRVVLVGGNWGQEHNPAWFYNLKATPRCSVVIRGRRKEMEAYEVDGEERERLWDLVLAVYPRGNDYAKRAGRRRIPVMVLCPVQKGLQSGEG